MSLNKIRKYVIYGLLLFGYWVLSSILIYKLGLWVKEAQMMENKVIILHQVTTQIIFMGIGVLLGLEQVIKAIQETGKWRVNLGKLIFLGLPSAYFTFYYLIHFYLQFISIRSSIVLFIMEKPFLQIAGVIFGYVLITSFYKEEAKG